MTGEGSSPGAEADDESADDPVVASEDRRRRRSFHRWGCGCLLAGAVLAAIAIAVPLTAMLVYGILDRRWYERELAYVREAGDPLTLEAMEAYYPTDPAIERTTALWLKAIEGVAGGFSDEEVEFFKHRRRQQEDRPDELGPPLAEKELIEARTIVMRYRESLDAARVARDSGGVARYDVGFGKVALPHNEQGDALRDLVSLLALDAEVRLAEQDPDGAVESVLTMLAAGESLRNEPIFVSQLTRAGCIGHAADLAPQIVAKREVSDDALARLQEAFAQVDMPDGYRRALRGERFIWLRIVRGDAPAGDSDVSAFASLPFRDADAAKTLEFYRRIAEAAEENLLAVDEPMGRAGEEAERIADSPIDAKRYTLTVMYMPALYGLALSALQGQAVADTAATAIACERYRRAEGSFPAQLADLVPKYLPEVPLDPFDDQPLRYAVDDQGAVVYTVGRNRVDDGDAPLFVGEGFVDPSVGDLPFRLIESGEKNRREEANTP